MYYPILEYTLQIVSTKENYWTGPDRTRPDRTRWDRTGLDMSGQGGEVGQST